jgi:tetratricopeptide (TPR) repeat protein
VAIPLYVSKNDLTTAVNLAESGMATLSTMKPGEQDELLTMLATLYITSTPPAVDKAVALYEQILQRRPHDYLAMNNLAYVLSEQANPPRLKEAMGYAQQAYEESSKTGAPDLLVVDTRAWLMIQNGQVDDGIRILHDIVDRATFPEPHYHLAEGYLRKKQGEDAQRELGLAMDQLQQMKDAKKPFDNSLEGKLQAAKQEADKMVANKTQVGAAP